MPDAIGNGFVGDFANKVFVARALGLGGSFSEAGLFLRRDLRTNEFEGNFVKGVL